MFLPLEPPPHPPVAVCAVAMPLAFFYVSSQFLVPIWLSLPPYKAVIPTPGYLKELTHHCYRILKPVTVDNMIFYARSHFLPMDCRKSRSSLFSIRSRSNSVGFPDAAAGRPSGDALWDVVIFQLSVWPASGCTGSPTISPVCVPD